MQQTKLLIVDGHNWARRGLTAGRTVRNLWEEVWNWCQQGPVFVVWDGPGSRGPRSKIYPEYKKGRKMMGEDLSDAFKFLQQMLVLTPATIFTVPDFEADDVIAELATRWKGPVHIHSNDLDLAALPGVTTEYPHDLPCDRKYLRLYKTLVGDKSDNIPGLKGFGQKSWEALQESDIMFIDAAFKGVGDWNDEDLQNLLKKALPKKFRNQLRSQIYDLRKFYRIVGFFDVPPHSVREHIVNGTPNHAGAIAIFEQFLHTDPNRPEELSDSGISSLARDPLS